MAEQSKIAQALDKKLNQLAELPSVVQYENTNVKLPDSDLFLEAFFIPGESYYNTLGIDAKAHEFGIYQINVGSLSGIGRKDAIMMADKIRDHFSRGSILTQGAVNVRLVKTAIGPGNISNKDNRYRIPVSVYYQSYS